MLSFTKVQGLPDFVKIFFRVVIRRKREKKQIDKE